MMPGASPTLLSLLSLRSELERRNCAGHHSARFLLGQQLFGQQLFGQQLFGQQQVPVTSAAAFVLRLTPTHSLR